GLLVGLVPASRANTSLDAPAAPSDQLARTHGPDRVRVRMVGVARARAPARIPAHVAGLGSTVATRHRSRDHGARAPGSAAPHLSCDVRRGGGTVVCAAPPHSAAA